MVTIESVIPWDDIEQRVRITPLLSDPNVFPYEEAQISLREFSFDAVHAIGDIVPARTTSLYIARNLLAVQAQIAADIAPEGYDPLRMEHGLLLASVNAKGEQQLTGFVPPIVEENDEGDVFVLDGSHRTNRGLRDLGKTSFLGIHITGIRPDCPAYAYPNDWNEVVLYDEPPTLPELRKRYRQDVDIYRLYRNFAALNGSVPRYGA